MRLVRVAAGILLAECTEGAPIRTARSANPQCNPTAAGCGDRRCALQAKQRVTDAAVLQPLREKPQQPWRKKSGKTAWLLDGVSHPEMRCGLNNNRAYVEVSLLQSHQERF